MLFARYEAVLFTFFAAGSALPYNVLGKVHARLLDGIPDRDPLRILARDSWDLDSLDILTGRSLFGDGDDDHSLIRRGPCLSKGDCRSSDGGSQEMVQQTRQSTRKANTQTSTPPTPLSSSPGSIPRSDSGHMNRQLAALRRTRSADSSGGGSIHGSALELTRSQSLGAEARDRLPPLQAMNSVGSRLSYPTTPGNSRPSSATHSDAVVPSTRSSRSGYQDSIGMLYGDPPLPPRRRRGQEISRAPTMQSVAGSPPDSPDSPFPPIPVWRGDSGRGPSAPAAPTSQAYADPTRRPRREQLISAESLPAPPRSVQKRSIAGGLDRRGCFGKGCFGKVRTIGSGGPSSNTGEAASSSKSPTKNSGRKTPPPETTMHTQASLGREETRRKRLVQPSQRRLSTANVNGRFGAGELGTNRPDSQQDSSKTQRVIEPEVPRRSSERSMSVGSGSSRQRVLPALNLRNGGEGLKPTHSNLRQLFPQGLDSTRTSSGESSPRAASTRRKDVKSGGRGSRKPVAEPLDLHPSVWESAPTMSAMLARKRARRGSSGSRDPGLTPPPSPARSSSSRRRGSRTPSLDSLGFRQTGPMVPFSVAATNGMFNTGSEESL